MAFNPAQPNQPVNRSEIEALHAQLRELRVQAERENLKKN